MRNDRSKKLALVTGATGLIGGEIALRLALSDWDVLALVRPNGDKTPSDRLFERLQQSPVARTTDLSRIQAVSGDVTQPLLGLPAGELQTPAVVVHCAADTSFLTKASFDHPNVLAAENVINYIASKSGKPRLVLFSTASVTLGPAGAVVSEDSPNTGHENGYTFSKRIAERRFRESGVFGCVLRPSNVLSRNIDNRAMARSLLWVISMLSELGALPVNPATRLDIVPVDFVAETVVRLLNKPMISHTCYHISSGATSSVTCREVIESLYDVLPSFKSAQFLGAGPWPPRLLTSVKTRRMVKAIDYYLPFINADVVYSDDRIRNELDGDLPPCPKGTEYLPDLMKQVSLAEAFNESLRP